MDLPGAVAGLAILDEPDKRRILGETARRLFALPETVAAGCMRDG